MTARRRVRWLATFVLLALAFAVTAAGCGGGGGGKKVPDVKGKSLVEAAKRLSEAQFLVRQPVTIVRGKPPRHTVLKQDPEGGSSAKPGTTVTLEVSDGVKKK